MPARDDLVALTENPTRFLTDGDPILRRMAVTALPPREAQTLIATLEALATDGEPPVRAAVAEKLGVCGSAALGALAALADDEDPRVREAVATAYGEVGEADTIPWLSDAATVDPDRQVREAAVASLGAIGHSDAIDVLLAVLAGGPPQVRRRAVAALTVFDDDRIEQAIRTAARDRNPAVREAAEMVVGREPPETADGAGRTT